MIERLFSKLMPYKSTVFVPAYIASFLANWLFLINGYGCPDNLCEGATFYHGADWALSIGRWAIKYINMGTLNIVTPIFNVAISVFCCCIATILIAKLFSLRNEYFISLTAIFLSVGEAVTCQYLYIYMDLAYSCALVLSTLSAYCFLRYYNNFKKMALASLLLAVSLGAYQSYIGFTATIIMMYLILKLIRGEPILKIGLYALLMGVGGCISYLVVLNFLQAFHHVTMADYSGANEIGIANSLNHLGESIKTIYTDFYSYITAGINYRNVLLLLICGIIVIYSIHWITFFARRKKIASTCMLLLCFFSLPLCMNIVTIIAPKHATSSLMSHQIQLILPFLFALLENAAVGNRSAGKIAVSLSVISGTLLCWSCIITAYATHSSMAFVYQYMEHYTTSILAKIYSDAVYEPNSRILLVGYPDEKEIQRSNPLYDYSYHYSAIFWNGEYGTLTCWQKYILYYFSIDTGTISTDEYHMIIGSPEFSNLSCYPNENSIDRIGDIVFIKLQDSPPKD